MAVRFADDVLQEPCVRSRGVRSGAGRDDQLWQSSSIGFHLTVSGAGLASLEQST